MLAVCMEWKLVRIFSLVCMIYRRFEQQTFLGSKVDNFIGSLALIGAVCVRALFNTRCQISRRPCECASSHCAKCFLLVVLLCSYGCFPLYSFVISTSAIAFTYRMGNRSPLFEPFCSQSSPARCSRKPSSSPIWLSFGELLSLCFIKITSASE